MTNHAIERGDDDPDDAFAAEYFGRLRLERPIAGGLLFPRAELLGADWSWVDADGKGGSMGEQTVADLAQNALADIFGQLEQLGQLARGKCRSSYGVIANPPVSRTQVAHALDYAESLIEYGRAQLGYLPASTLHLNERVVFTRAGEETWGIYVGMGLGGKLRIRVPGENGEESSNVELEENEVRRVSK